MNERCSITTHKLKMALLAKIDDDYHFVAEVAGRNLPGIREKVSGEVMHRYLDQWGDALSDQGTLKLLIADESDYGLALWHVAPFTGVFSPRERWAILRGESLQ